jgi:hypothetical protein
VARVLIRESVPSESSARHTVAATWVKLNRHFSTALMPRMCAEVWRESTKLVLFAIVLFVQGFRQLAGPTMVTI